MSEAQPRARLVLRAGKPEAFRTSGGKAAENADPDQMTRNLGASRFVVEPCIKYHHKRDRY